MALQHPARGSRLRLPGLSQPAGEGAGRLALHRSDVAAVGRRRLLLHALPPRLDGGAADGDRLALARLLPRSLRRDRPARARAYAALRTEPLARCSARRTRGRGSRRRSPVRCSCREHRRLAADRGDEHCLSACGRAAARPSRRRPGDHRLAARPRLAVHSRRHRCARPGGQRRPLPGGGRLDGQHHAARCRLAARDAPPRRRFLAAGRPARRRPSRGRTRARAAGGLRPELARHPRLRAVRAAEHAGRRPRRDLDARGGRPDGVHVPREDAAAHEDPHRGGDGRAHRRREPAQADDRPRRDTRRSDDGCPDAARPRRVQGVQRHVRPSSR